MCESLGRPMDFDPAPISVMELRYVVQFRVDTLITEVANNIMHGYLYRALHSPEKS